MKKILVIGMSDTLGGVETYIYNLIKMIDKKKFTFDFLVIGQDNKSVFEKEINDILGNDKNHFYYSPNLKKHYVETQKWLTQFYKKNQYDIIYLNTCTAARISYCVKGLKNNRTKLITHSHNGKADNWKGSLTNKLIKKYTTKRSAYRLACSDLAYSYLFSDSMSGKWFVPNGVEIDRFKFNEVERRIIRVQNNISKDNIVIGNVGRFSAQKNHRYFLDLAEKLDNKFVFLLLGNGELKEEFIEKVKECGLEDKFRVVSAKTDVERYYSAMDVFVTPSIFEGLPITAIEAQCNGLPCVFSTYITQQVKLSSNCEFVDLEDKGKWIEVISNFSKSRYDGVKVITDNKFDIDSTVKMMEMIFEEL